ncbi:DUF6088 family protein [Neptunomonas sp.]|uniref:DUF6088 family protein n=1 Tax=Neptunomonas sp. TaxID=1971898 RepID=UPI003561C645
MTVIQKTEEYIKHKPFGAIFSFNQVARKLNVPKDSLSHALAKLKAENQVSQLERGLWYRPKSTRFGVIGPKPEIVADIIAEERNAFILPAGAAAVHALGWSTQMSMRYNYMSTKRIEPLCVNKHQITFRYSRAFEDAVKKLEGINPEEKKRAATLWIALEFMGNEESQAKSRLVQDTFSRLSARAQTKLYIAFSGKLRWVTAIVGVH